MSEKIVDEFIRLAKIYGPSGNERAAADYLKSRLKETGFTVFEDDAGKKVGGNTGNIIACLKGNSDSDITLLFSTHMDTVTPCENVNPVIKDGVIYSDGTTILGADDRSGIAAVICGIERARNEGIPFPDIEFVVSVAEEKGLLGAENLDFSRLKSSMGFVLDCSLSPGNIVSETPSHAVFDIKCTGKAAHAGIAPEKGINSIQMAAMAIAQIPLGRINEETVMNIGQINGGSATNIVPEETIISGEIRCFNEMALTNIFDNTKMVFEKAAADAGGTVEVLKMSRYAGYKLEKKSQIVNVISNAIKNLGKEITFNKYSGGSDANVFNLRGIPSVPVGMGVKNVHSRQESIAVENLKFGESVVKEIIKAINNK